MKISLVTTYYQFNKQNICILNSNTSGNSEIFNTNRKAGEHRSHHFKLGNVKINGYVLYIIYVYIVLL